ncbi:hypothetical protein BC938DRAFT_470966 [Jimgerdemannia flammicorona]|uniref:C3H1-type domain-containing protein n=1 Tax=Jimgerdemannia flammicorona TaxID=994334 RepID=A0A433Q935_9FUNG|nr:hypothetical protein BC938DRAFT_470966 [Jimgerdemannia flammicorona]
MQCRDGSFCCQYMVIAHMDQYLHPFNTPCRDTPFACTSTNDNHTTKFSHACKYGAQCRELSDSKHMKNFIHIGRPLCFQGAACMDLLNEEHLDLFSHPEIADIRSPCKHRQECKDRSQLCHIADYAHPSEGPPISSLGETCQDMNFSANAQEIIKATDAYFKKKGKNFQVPEEVVEWVKRLRPAHRVRPRIFKSILAHHHVMSADHILKLKNPKWASHEARHHPLVKKICEENKFGEIEQKHLEDLVECAVLVAHGNAASDPQLPSWVEDLALKKEACTQFLKSEEMKPLIDLGDRLVKATGDLAANPGGIGYEVDKLLGTNEHVFSILGPHTESKLRSFTPSVPIHSKEAVKKFHNSKLHPSCNDWAKAAAADICAQVMVTTGNTQITLDDVKKEWMNRDSHFVFEAHLPSLIPLSFVDKIIIPKQLGKLIAFLL